MGSEVAIVVTVPRPAGAATGRTAATVTTQSVYIQQVAFKEEMKVWRNPAAIRSWLIYTERPSFVGMSTVNMQAVLRDVAHVLTSVVETLNSLSGFQVRMFVPNGDDNSSGEGISLPEHIDIFI